MRRPDGQLSLDGANELEPGSLFGASAEITPVFKPGEIVATDGGARTIDLEGRERCPACGGELHRRTGDSAGYCQRCDRMRMVAPRLVR